MILGQGEFDNTESKQCSYQVSNLDKKKKKSNVMKPASGNLKHKCQIIWTEKQNL